MKQHFTVLTGAVTNALSFSALVLLLACTQAAQAQQLQDARPGLSLAAAMSAALTGNSSVLLARTQEEAAQGAVQSARGIFDLTFNAQGGATRANDPLKQSDRNALLQNGFDLSYNLSDTTTTQAEATKLFTNGLQANVVAAYTTSMSNLFPVSSTPRQSVGALTFQLRVPMLRNSGSAAAAPLRAAELEALAARGDLEFAVSNIVLSSALAYWDYLSKTQRLAIARSSEKRGQEALDELRKLIAADELPQAEINLALASQNDRRGARITAEQALLESRRTLGRALGFSAEATTGIGELVDGFPGYSGVNTDAVARSEALIARALEMRSDLTALRQRHEAAQILFDATRKNELPQLDLILGVTQSGLAEGKSPAEFGPAFGQNFGQGYSGKLVFQMPLGNNGARGSIRQQAAQVEAQRIRINELGH
ncbi:MAG: TolC family protein, partial [Limnohabitans sp.]